MNLLEPAYRVATRGSQPESAGEERGGWQQSPLRHALRYSFGEGWEIATGLVGLSYCVNHKIEQIQEVCKSWDVTRTRHNADACDCNTTSSKPPI